VSDTFDGARRASGLALFISLVLLLVLTVISVSAVQTSTLETRLARNQHDTLLAFQAAELALRDAEQFLDTIETASEFAAGAGRWLLPAAGAVDRWEEPGVWSGSGSVAVASAVGGVAEAPRYLIEYLASLQDDAGEVAVFRITARGIGGSANAQALLQTTYGRRVDGGADAVVATSRLDGGAALRTGRLSWRELDG
jgi:type IV pilus assembly protein PilX